MRRFHCECGHPIFFENSVCLGCGAGTGFLPSQRDMLTLKESSPGIWQEEGGEDRWKFCGNLNSCGCNWLLPAESAKLFCESCDTTRLAPGLSSEKNRKRWHVIETAKRRLLLTLLDLGLWGAGSRIRPVLALVFDFKESLPGDAALTGHQNGVITLNIAEADDDRREQVREQLYEPYRTVLGHLRHEVGHYFWDLLVKDSPYLAECRQIFGDDSADYAAAMQRHYAEGAPANWFENHVSSYATMHPWEDWAETWAHCLHMTDTMETADQSALSSRVKGPAHDPAQFTGIAGATQKNAVDYAAQVERWCGIVILANELSRSMGQPDVYPFALTLPVLKKLFFTQRVIKHAAT